MLNVIYRDAFNNIGLPDITDKRSLNDLTRNDLKRIMNAHTYFINKYGISYVNSKTYNTIDELLTALKVR